MNNINLIKETLGTYESDLLYDIEWRELTLEQYENIKDKLRKCYIVIDGYFRLYLTNGEGVRYTIEVMHLNDTVVLRL